MALYSQRPPIPEMTIQPILEDRLGPEIKEAAIGKSGIVREVEAGIMMNAPTVEALITWLQEKLQLLKKMDSAKDNRDIRTTHSDSGS